MAQHRHPKGKPYRRGRAADADETTRIYGLHPVRAALANPRRTVLRVRATPNALGRIDADIIAPVEQCDVRDLDSLVGRDAVHQGIVADVAPLAPIGLRDMVPADLVVVLDQVTDPHNVGAILRSAVAMGAGAVIMPGRGSVTETPVLAKAASGALDLIQIVRIGNLGNALGDLQRMGYLTIGLDSEGERDLVEMQPDRPTALVLGAEGRGLRPRTRDTVDALARLDLPGAITSLNVSNAAALSLYLVRRALDARNRNSAQNPA